MRVKAVLSGCLVFLTVLSTAGLPATAATPPPPYSAIPVVLLVPSDGTHVTQVVPAGLAYRVHAWGTYQIGSAPSQYGDASFWWDGIQGKSCESPGPALLMNGAKPWTQPCDPIGHEYSARMTCPRPTPCALEFWIDEGFYPDNSGALNVAILPERILDFAEEISLAPSQETPAIDQPLASVIIRDRPTNELCIDVRTVSDINVACVNRALLGDADALIPRGTTELLHVPSMTSPALSLQVEMFQASDGSKVFKAGSVANGTVPICTPSGPSDLSTFPMWGKDQALTLVLTLKADGEPLEPPLVIDVPYLGQVLAAAGCA